MTELDLNLLAPVMGERFASLRSFYTTDEVGAAADMYDFLQQFFQAHPKYASLPFYAFGESYAGHYVLLVGVEGEHYLVKDPGRKEVRHR